MRIRPQDIVNSNQSPFQTHHEARTEGDIEAVLNDQTAFLDVRSNLRVGDRVTICQYRKVDKKGAYMEGLVGFVSSRVVENDSHHVLLVPESPAVRVTPFVPAVPENPNDKGLIVKRVMPFDGFPFHVLDANGNIVERFKSKVEADAYADG